MDYEPEYIAIEQDGTRAFVTLQEANAIAVLDLTTNTFTEIIGLGAKDFSLQGNEIDPKDNDSDVLFQSVTAKGFYMPDTVAMYKWRGETYSSWPTREISERTTTIGPPPARSARWHH